MKRNYIEVELDPIVESRKERLGMSQQEMNDRLINYIKNERFKAGWLPYGEKRLRCKLGMHKWLYAKVDGAKFRVCIADCCKTID